MCIMEVRSGQRSSTMAQAMAHNTSTIERDLDMYRKVLGARDDHAGLQRLELAQRHMRDAYQILLSLFAYEVEQDVKHGRGAPLGERVGAERAAAVATVAEREAFDRSALSDEDWLSHFSAGDPSRLRHVKRDDVGMVMRAATVAASIDAEAIERTRALSDASAQLAEDISAGTDEYLDAAARAARDARKFETR